MTLLIKNGHVLDPATETDEEIDIFIEDGKIAKRGKKLKCKAERVIDAAGSYVMPGFIDLHVHLRDPGFEQKETIETKNVFLSITYVSSGSKITMSATFPGSISPLSIPMIFAGL